MSICRIYKIDHYYGAELPATIDLNAAQLHEIIEEIDGREIVKEQFDETGIRILRIETDYNSQGFVSEIREFTDDFVNPFKVDRFQYTPEGKLLMEQTFHDESQTSGTQYVYDSLGRLMHMRTTDEEGVHHDMNNNFDIGNLHPKSQQFISKDECWKEILYKYSDRGDRSRVVEQTIDNKEDKFQSRIIRFYEFGEMKNGVVAEYYNTNGRFIEEVREIRDSKGNVLQEAIYPDDADDSIPYSATVSKYDFVGNCIYLESSYHGKVNMRQYSTYDQRRRKTMELASSSESTLYIYKYEE